MAQAEGIGPDIGREDKKRPPEDESIDIDVSQFEEEDPQRDMKIEAAKKFGEVLKNGGPDKEMALSFEEFDYLSDAIDEKLNKEEIDSKEYARQLKLLQETPRIMPEKAVVKEDKKSDKQEEPLELTEEMVVKDYKPPTPGSIKKEDSKDSLSQDKKTVVEKLKQTQQDRQEGKLKPFTDEAKDKMFKLREEIKAVKKRPEVEAEAKRLEEAGLTDPDAIMSSLKKRSQELQAESKQKGTQLREEGKKKAEAYQKEMQSKREATKKAAEEYKRKKFEKKYARNLMQFEEQIDQGLDNINLEAKKSEKKLKDDLARTQKAKRDPSQMGASELRESSKEAYQAGAQEGEYSVSGSTQKSEEPKNKKGIWGTIRGWFRR